MIVERIAISVLSLSGQLGEVKSFKIIGNFKILVSWLYRVIFWRAPGFIASAIACHQANRQLEFFQ